MSLNLCFSCLFWEIWLGFYTFQEFRFSAANFMCQWCSQQKPHLIAYCIVFHRMLCFPLPSIPEALLTGCKSCVWISIRTTGSQTCYHLSNSYANGMCVFINKWEDMRRPLLMPSGSLRTMPVWAATGTRRGLQHIGRTTDHICMMS